MSETHDDELRRRWAPTLGTEQPQPERGEAPDDIDRMLERLKRQGQRYGDAMADKWPHTAGQRGAPGIYSWTTTTTSSTSPSIHVTPSTFHTASSTSGAITTTLTSSEEARAFVADINGKTFVSAPASALQKADFKEPTLDEIVAEHLLWIDGRFVGANEPNRNGAMWSAGDLELGMGTVLYGPLNWLHEARHVIGSLVKADYVDPTKQAQTAEAGDRLPPIQPHITARAAVWRWIWPDEAYVIQQASDLNQLWYSMECISKEVACTGPDGCGKSTSYAEYMAGAACDHIRQRASVRRFVNPVFLGGAVIVPPSRPGWAEADARVMQQASGMAEAAFDQAGRPDIPATTWEQMMAQLVKFSAA